MAGILKIDGAVIDLEDSPWSVQRLTLSFDQADMLEFGETGVTLPPSLHCGQQAEYEEDGTLRFKGEIASVHPGTIGEGPIAVGYRALGLKWVAGNVPVTNPQDGTGVCRFNLPSSDPDYIPSLSGMSVKDILTYLFDGHAAALSAFGVVGYNAADLDPLTIVPPTTSGVLIQGASFVDQAEHFLQTWYAQFALYIPADGIIRIVDTTDLTQTTFTLDSDPITVEDVSRDTSQCYTRVVLRGFGLIEPAYLSLADGTLTEAFTTADKLAWTWYSFIQPTGGISDGTITAVTSTQITVRSEDASQTWPVNYWNSIEAVVQLVNPAVSDISFTESRQITACTALTAGGTSVLTLDTPLNNSGYSVYHIWGQPPKGSDTWRLYNIKPQSVAQHLVKQFAHSIPWRPTDQTVVQTLFPAAVICHSPNGRKPYDEFPATFEILPATGQIRFSEPVVRPFGSLPKLQKGGASIDGIPDDIKVVLAYSRGTLQAVCPPDVYGVPQYSGTGYTDDGIENTLYRDYPQWQWGNDSSSYQELACQILKTVSDTLVTGTLTWYGKLSSALDLGIAVNVARVGGTTGLESINAAARTVVLELPQEGPSPWITRLMFSTQRRPFSGDALYTHPMFGGQAGFEGSVDMSSPAAVARGFAGGLGFMGDAGAEHAAQILGNSDDLRKSLGLEVKQPERQESAEPAASPQFGGFGGFAGDNGEGRAQGGRRRPKRKRPTLKPRSERTAENRPGFVGPPRPPTIAGPPRELSAEGQREQRAQRSHAGVRGRNDDTPRRPRPTGFVGPPKPTGPPPIAGPPRSLSHEGQREALAQRPHTELRNRGRRDDVPAKSKPPGPVAKQPPARGSNKHTAVRGRHDDDASA
jgi:hypothetical protein